MTNKSQAGPHQATCYMADVRISMGCFKSHRLNTLKQIIPKSMGSWLRKAALYEPNRRVEVFWATHRPYRCPMSTSKT